MRSVRIPWVDPKSHNSQMPLQKWAMSSLHRSEKEDRGQCRVRYSGPQDAPSLSLASAEDCIQFLLPHSWSKTCQCKGSLWNMLSIPFMTHVNTLVYFNQPLVLCSLVILPNSMRIICKQLLYPIVSGIMNELGACSVQSE